MLESDVIVIGSGFGGSVAALRLAEQGRRVTVLEQGRRISTTDLEAGNQSLKRLYWAPPLGMRGYFTQHIFKDVGIVGGVGVGGGSLVYAAVLLEPKAAFFEDEAWSRLGVDWQRELAPHYETAKRMLGRAPNPHLAAQDAHLKQAAEALGAADTFGPVPNGIFFGPAGERPTPGVTHADPYFGGQGPARTACTACGRCLAGCVPGAKNSLDKNYLYLAERLGAKIIPERRAVEIRPLGGGGYEVAAESPFEKGVLERYRAGNVIVAAGVVGTLSLLFRCRDDLATLPALSRHLGTRVRTNSEAIVGILGPEGAEPVDTGGPAVSSDFYPNAHTHVTQNRFPPAYEFMKWYFGPMVDDAVPWRRALRTIGAFLLRPWAAVAAWRRKRWTTQVSVLTVMQHVDNEMAFRWGRGVLTGFRKGLVSQVPRGKAAPTFLKEANDAARAVAKAWGGRPQNMVTESIFGLSSTAHILGGCPMGKNAGEGVIGTDHQVHGYPGLYVMDGAAVSANVGVNPSLTIAAMAERASRMAGSPTPR